MRSIRSKARIIWAIKMRSKRCATMLREPSSSWERCWVCRFRGRRRARSRSDWFGGHTRPLDPKRSGFEARRRDAFVSYSADRTGHTMLHTLYENALKNNVRFFSEFFVTELLYENGVASGVVAIEILTGEVHVFHAKAVMFATGGDGRIWRITSNAHVGTGDGFMLAYNAGLPLEDMEFMQFHPTGLWKLGILVSEAARGEGGILRNKDGERFMERYAPTVKDLAPRDMVSLRAIIPGNS